MKELDLASITWVCLNLNRFLNVETAYQPPRLSTEPSDRSSSSEWNPRRRRAAGRAVALGGTGVGATAVVS
jgi:hypothetical protein